MGHFTAAEHSDIRRKWEGDRGEERDESERHNLNWSLGVFCVLGGLLVKATFRFTGLALSASAVTGNYKQAKCVTCPNAVAESLREHRAHAG